jgi:hypothetical protein
MSKIIDYIKENIIIISIIVFSVLFLLVIIKIKGINLNAPKPETKLIQQVIVETFGSLDSNNISMQDSKANIEKMELDPADTLCKSYLGNSAKLENVCNQLTETSCSQINCCVFTNNKCVAGGSNGPTYKTDKDGKLITIDNYYYLGKCRGKCNI